MRTGQEVDVKDDEKSIIPISKDIELDAQKKGGDQQLTQTIEHQSNAPNVWKHITKDQQDESVKNASSNTNKREKK